MQSATILLYICLVPAAGLSADSAISRLGKQGTDSVAYSNRALSAAAPGATKSNAGAVTERLPAAEFDRADLEAYLHFHAEAKWGAPGPLVPMPRHEPVRH